VLVDLAYVERKIKRAMDLIKKPEEALAELTLAQTRGIEMSVNKEDNPLVSVQEALRLAERMVEEEKLDVAKENLQIAQFHLETYRALLGKDAGEKIKKLQEDITAVSNKLQMKEAAGTIREFWERVTGWFKKGTQEAQVTDQEAEEEKEE
jgi:hypothetical protein